MPRFHPLVGSNVLNAAGTGQGRNGRFGACATEDLPFLGLEPGSPAFPQKEKSSSSASRKSSSFPKNSSSPCSKWSVGKRPSLRNA